jgi:asparagine synthase (glutamine-hydrolysing)
MCDLLHRRGPDEQGFYWGENVALGHRRLSIIDLAEGQQPMSNKEKTIFIVFNGEIYNYKELREELIAEGFSFQTNSDTEVIINGYAAYGTDVLQHLNGMFAFAIYDSSRKRLFVARDRVGKKPLYYHADNDGFLFASELKSLLAHPEVTREINPEAVDKFFSYTYIPAPLTIFKGISKLRPGHFLIYESGNLTIKQYWDVKYSLPEKERSEDEYFEEFAPLLRDAVQRRLISDVPLGAFLSGGLDSSTVVALMQSVCSDPVKTFSIGFNEREYSELDDAMLVANSLGTNHHEKIVTPDAIDLLPEIVWNCSEPFGDSSAVPTYLVSQFAREHVTVVLSGDGGDELFAGYNSYMDRDKYESFRLLPKLLREKIIGPLAAALPISAKGKFFLKKISSLDQKGLSQYTGIFPLIKDELFGHDLQHQLATLDPPESVLDYWKNMPTSSRLSTMQYLDTKVYMPEDILTKVDRMSMANSLETRAPVLDYHLVEFAATIPPHLQVKDGQGKYILRKLAGQLLPQQILTKKKQGFAIPRDTWFKEQLKEYAANMLQSEKFKNRGYFNQKTVDLVLTEHVRGKRDYSTWIWCMIIFELWHQIFMDQDTRRI